MDEVKKDSLTPEKGAPEQDEPISDPKPSETPEDAPVDFPEPDVK